LSSSDPVRYLQASGAAECAGHALSVLDTPLSVLDKRGRRAGRENAPPDGLDRVLDRQDFVVEPAHGLEPF
jgi:hypothetical protein